MEAYFEFTQAAPNGATKSFIFKLEDPAKITEARKIIRTNGSKCHIRGTIVAKRAPYNPDWSFHLTPSSIGFFEMAIEVCDANVTYVEEHLDEVGGTTLPGNHWCPWSSELTREVTNQIVPTLK